MSRYYSSILWHRMTAMSNGSLLVRSFGYLISTMAKRYLHPSAWFPVPSRLCISSCGSWTFPNADGEGCRRTSKWAWGTRSPGWVTETAPRPRGARLSLPPSFHVRPVILMGELRRCWKWPSTPWSFIVWYYRHHVSGCHLVCALLLVIISRKLPG